MLQLNGLFIAFRLSIHVYRMEPLCCELMLVKASHDPGDPRGDDDGVSSRGGLFQPVLGLAAVCIGALGTPHQQLRVDPGPLLQVFLHQVGQGFDEEGVVVGGGTAGHPLGPGLFAHVLGILNVQLVQGLNVVVDKGNGHQQQVALTTFDQVWAEKKKKMQLRLLLRGWPGLDLGLGLDR